MSANFSLDARLAGLLYGNILHRDSDEDGFRFHLGLLRSNAATIEELIYKFFTSDEFIEKFVVNQTPNELVANLIRAFFSSADITLADHVEFRRILVRNGFDSTIREFIKDKRFADRHGGINIPRYQER